MKDEVTLEISEMTVRRGGRQLGPVSLSLGKGEWASLVGANGSGKSSILEAIAGFLPVESGVIRLGGREVTGLQPPTEPWQRGIGWLGQQRGLWPHMTLREQAQLLCENPNPDTIEKTAEALDLQTLIDRRPDQLSGGEAQRGELLRTICGGAPVLILDEPFSAQNRQQRDRIIEVLQGELETGRSILLAVHEPIEGIDSYHLDEEASL